MIAQDVTARFAGAVPYLKAFARVLGGHVHLLAAMQGDAARTRLASFYINRMLPEHESLLAQVLAGEDDVMAITIEDLAS